MARNMAIGRIGTRRHATCVAMPTSEPPRILHKKPSPRVTDLERLTTLCSVSYAPLLVFNSCAELGAAESVVLKRQKRMYCKPTEILLADIVVAYVFILRDRIRCGV